MITLEDTQDLIINAPAYRTDIDYPENLTDAIWSVLRSAAVDTWEYRHHATDVMIRLCNISFLQGKESAAKEIKDFLLDTH